MDHDRLFKQLLQAFFSEFVELLLPAVDAYLDRSPAEFQAKAEADFPKRMFRYFARLYERFDLPVYPIALFSYDEPLRPEPTEHRVEFPDRLVLSFQYEVIQLNRLDWKDFACRPNPWRRP